jgi:hypothetical protein
MTFCARATVFIALFCVGCGEADPITKPDLAAPEQGEVLCTTPACAAQPCTAGCQFAIVPTTGDCPASQAARVAGTVVRGCSRLCGFYKPDSLSSSYAGYCWHYDRNQPGACQTPTCGWNVACEVHVAAFAENQAVICPSDEQCFNGLLPQDAAAFCPDLAVVD